MPVPSSGPLWHSQLGAGRGGAGICLRPHQQGFASVLFSPDRYDSLKTSWASCVSDYNSLQWVKAAQTHRSETSFLCLGLWDMALKGFWRLLVKPGESKCYDSQKPSHLAKSFESSLEGCSALSVTPDSGTLEILPCPHQNLATAQASPRGDEYLDGGPSRPWLGSQQ